MVTFMLYQSTIKLIIKYSNQLMAVNGNAKAVLIEQLSNTGN